MARTYRKFSRMVYSLEIILWPNLRTVTLAELSQPLQIGLTRPWYGALSTRVGNPMTTTSSFFLMDTSNGTADTQDSLPLKCVTISSLVIITGTPPSMDPVTLAPLTIRVSPASWLHKISRTLMNMIRSPTTRFLIPTRTKTSTRTTLSNLPSLATTNLVIITKLPQFPLANSWQSKISSLFRSTSINQLLLPAFSTSPSALSTILAMFPGAPSAIGAIEATHATPALNSACKVSGSIQKTRLMYKISRVMSAKMLCLACRMRLHMTIYGRFEIREGFWSRCWYG